MGSGRKPASPGKLPGLAVRGWGGGSALLSPRNDLDVLGGELGIGLGVLGRPLLLQGLAVLLGHGLARGLVGHGGAPWWSAVAPCARAYAAGEAPRAC